MPSREVPVTLCRFSSYLNFLGRLSKNPQMLNFMKICPVRAQLPHADRQTDMLRNFANAS